MRSIAETEVATTEEFNRLLLAFGRELGPAARPKVLAFLHLLRDAEDVVADIAVGPDGSLALVLTGHGDAGDQMIPFFS